MAETSQRVLFVDVGDALAPSRGLVAGTGHLVDAVSWDAASQEIPRHDRPPAVAVIGPGVPNPAGVARRLRQMHPSIHVVFVAGPGAHARLRTALLYSAPAGTPWRLVELRDEEVAAAVAEALEASRRARQVRTTLDRINLQIAAPGHGDSHAWRRLRVSDQFLASVLKHAQDAIISLDLHGNVLSWNDGAEKVFGRQAQDVIGENIDRVISARAGLGELVAAAAREGSVRSELRCEVRGREVVIDATLSAIEEHRSEVLAVAAILRDVTERVHTQAKLAANEARFRALADNIPQLAWITDEQGSIVWYNRRWYEYTGTTLEEMRGRGWMVVHHPDHKERVLERFEAHVAAGREWEDTFPLRSKDGEYRWFLSRAFPIRDPHGAIRQWFGTNTDITEQRAAQEELREADRRKTEFIGVLSHELRNPLAPIRNSVYLLERVPGDSSTAVTARQVIRRQTEHLTRLVDELLDVTRITRGKMVLARTVTDLCALVRSATEDHRALVEGADLGLHVSLPSHPVRSEVDAARITQVIGNLLHNSLKFTPPGGWIAVDLAQEGGRAVLSVRDSGAGIEPELLRALFEPFVQGERTMDPGKGGLGLGLALAKGIVEMHGGEIHAASEGADRGAQFTVRLPLAAAAGPTVAAGDEEAAPEGARGRRVLIVDDNRDAADSLAQLVALFGHDAEVAHDGPGALARIQVRRPDFVLCDIGLPGMDGYEVARRIRDSGAPIRLVAVSGYAQPEDLRLAAAAGFEDHLAKPPPPERIRRLLAADPRP